MVEEEPLFTKEAMIKAFIKRCETIKNPIDNSRLPAGSPMYYYCKVCGSLSDTKPEGWFMGSVKKLCEECENLKVMGFLEDDLKAYGDLDKGSHE